jgi:hypothetical protein
MNSILLLKTILLAVLVLSVVYSKKNYGSAIGAILSPLGASTAVYFLAYVVYPNYYGLGFLDYEFAPLTLSEQSRIDVNYLGILAMYGLLVGCVLSEKFPLPTNLERSIKVVPEISALFSLVAMLSTCSLTVSLIPFLIESTDFGSIRAKFLLAMEGRGYLSLLLWLSAGTSFCGIVSASTNRDRNLAYLHLLFFSGLCVIVSTRFALTGLYASLILFWTVNAKSEFFRGWKFAGLTCTLLAMIGTLAGAVRGLSNYPFADRLDALLIFFLFTFDSFQATSVVVSSTQNASFGNIYLEDLVFRFLPRAVFDEKPVIYGAVRLQEYFYPDSLPSSGIPIATYPVSMVGESYATFRFFGAFGIPLLVGFVASRLYKSLVRVCLGSHLRIPRSYTAAMIACVWVINPLEYWRSPSWFFSAVFFSYIFFGSVTTLCGFWRPTKFTVDNQNRERARRLD